ncbi:MAG: hypothetical protein QHH14_08055 [Clostridiales bacterium]|nr:hypothetical protein [Clostridiales bacterium]
MTSPDLLDITFQVTRVLEKLGIPYYVGGSLASSAFGMARATLDVDLVADIKNEHVPALEEALRDDYYIDKEMVLEAVRQRTCFNVIHMNTAFKVDIFIVKDKELSRMALRRRVKKNISEKGSRELYFASPEDIILAKLEWHKAGGQIGERQWLDILGVIKVQASLLDIDYLKKWAARTDVLDLLVKALQEGGMA